MKVIGVVESYGKALEHIKEMHPEAWATRSFRIQHYEDSCECHPWAMVLTDTAVNPIYEPN